MENRKLTTKEKLKRRGKLKVSYLTTYHLQNMILTNHRTKEKQKLASASDKHIEPDEKVTSSSNT